MNPLQLFALLAGLAGWCLHKKWWGAFFFFAAGMLFVLVNLIALVMMLRPGLN